LPKICTLWVGRQQRYERQTDGPCQGERNVITFAEKLIKL